MAANFQILLVWKRGAEVRANFYVMLVVKDFWEGAGSCLGFDPESLSELDRGP